MKIKNSYKLIILGSAGNGVRMMCRILVKNLNEKYPNASITYYFDYDSTVRGGKTTSYISINNKKPIHEFIFSKCDLLVQFKNFRLNNFEAQEIIAPENSKKAENINFEKKALKNFKTQLYANMIALGYLSAKLQLGDKIDSLDELNQKAFKLGYSLFK